jgi:phage repressor protein C with HTH and peptisase S24 domain
MSLTIQLPLNIEQNLRETAIKQGFSLENYVMHLLTLNSKAKETKKKRKELSESDLLMRIHLDVDPKELEEYYRLGTVFKTGTLTEEEYEKLLELNDLIEIAHAKRMKYLLALAKMRQVSLETIMDDFGIKRHLV